MRPVCATLLFSRSVIVFLVCFVSYVFIISAQYVYNEYIFIQFHVFKKIHKMYLTFFMFSHLVLYLLEEFASKIINSREEI